MISTVPVKTEADWQGLLVQSISPLNASFVTAMGGSPVAMSFTEAYQAIQKKVVACTMQAPSMVLSYKLYEICKYETMGYLEPASAMATINLDVYNKMPANVQKALVEAGQEAMKEANEKMIKRAATNVPAILDKGMEIYNLPKAERDIWKAKVQSFVDGEIAKMGDFGNNLKQIAEEVNASYPYPY
jgi:TRAP-type C4-dicarboxylate transport system substrate-binding protein